MSSTALYYLKSTFRRCPALQLYHEKKHIEKNTEKNTEAIKIKSTTALFNENKNARMSGRCPEGVQIIGMCNNAYISIKKGHSKHIIYSFAFNTL